MREILEEIQNSFELFDRKEGWDDEKALPVNKKAYCKAMELLFCMIHNVGIIECPEINLCPDGSIDLSWRVKDKASLLINVTETSICWYGDDGFDNDETNGKQSECFSEELFNWVKLKLLKSNQLTKRSGLNSGVDKVIDEIRERIISTMDIPDSIKKFFQKN